jgi:small-conductance mechanosensitive channel
MNIVASFLSSELFKIGSFEVNLIKIFSIVLLIITGYISNKFFNRIIMNRAKNYSNLKQKGKFEAINQLKNYVIIVICGILILQVVGVNISILLASSAALLVGVGLGLQNLITNFVSGISLMFGRTISINDVVIIEKNIGRVRHIGFRTTEIITPLDQSILIPNATIINSVVQNLTHHANQSGFIIPIRIDYLENIENVKKVLVESALSHTDVLSTPAPSVFCSDFGEIGIELELRIWVASIFKIENIKSDIRYTILKEFKKQNINIPLPHYDIKLEK